MAISENSPATSSPSISKVAVIGAGAAGLPAAKRLRDYGINVTIFERNSAAGGIWVYSEQKPLRSSFPSNNPARVDPSTLLPEGQALPFTEAYDDKTVWLRHAPPGPCYNSLRSTSTLPLMTYQGHEYPPGTETFTDHHAIAEYLQRFVKDFGLDSIIRYNTRVENVEKTKTGDQSSWRIVSRRLSRTADGGTIGTWSEETFDAVVVANGHYHSAHIPDYPGLSEWAEKWPQDIFHSKHFRRPEDFKDKTVLIVGNGISSMDISQEVALGAKQIYQAVRKEDGNPPGIKAIKSLVRSLAPGNLTQVAEIERFGSVVGGPDARDSQVFLKDGTILEGIDKVLLCTGYLYTYPFLNTFPGTAEEALITDGNQVLNLHKDIFSIYDPTLAFVGLNVNIGAFSFFDIQAMAVAAVFAGKAFLPSFSEMESESKARKAKWNGGRGFHELGPDAEKEYADYIVEWVNRDAEKSGSRIRVQGQDEAWWERRFAMIEDLLRDIFSTKKYYPEMDEQMIEERVQELHKKLERISKGAE